MASERKQRRPASTTLPALDSKSPLTVDSLMLFQRFLPPVDVRRVDSSLESEIQKHLRLCETAVLMYARNGFYWCNLPEHPLPEVNVAVAQLLEKVGFEIRGEVDAYTMSVRRKYSKDKFIEATIVERHFTAVWTFAKPIDPRRFAREEKSRDRAQEYAWATNVPVLQSKISGDKLTAGDDTIWAALLDVNFIIEVQCIHNIHTLCIFDKNGAILHFERTAVTYGALFGPDVSDVRQWENRASEIVKELSATDHKNPK